MLEPSTELAIAAMRKFVQARNNIARTEEVVYELYLQATCYQIVG